MLFDGECLGALVCGAPQQVNLAVAAWMADPRQVGAQFLADAAEVPAWAPNAWRSGWCEPDALAPLLSAGAPQGNAAIEAWQALMAASDLL